MSGVQRSITASPAPAASSTQVLLPLPQWSVHRLPNNALGWKWLTPRPQLPDKLRIKGFTFSDQYLHESRKKKKKKSYYSQHPLFGKIKLKSLPPPRTSTLDSCDQEKTLDSQLNCRAEKNKTRILHIADLCGHLCSVHGGHCSHLAGTSTLHHLLSLLLPHAALRHRLEQPADKTRGVISCFSFI